MLCVGGASKPEMYDAENNEMIRWLANQSPERRHFAAIHLNWGYAMPCVEWLVTREDCDLSTCIALFWAGNPEEFLQYPNSESVRQAGEDLDTFEFLGGIVKREAQGFYKRRQISINPEDFGRPDLYDKEAAKFRVENLPWNLAPVFRETFKGVEVNDAVGRARFITDEFRTLLKKLGTNIPTRY